MRYFIKMSASILNAKENIMKKMALFILIGLFLLALPVRAQINLIHEFSGNPDGQIPTGSLIISGSTLFGMTAYGGLGIGTIFKMQTDRTGFTLLHSFSGGTKDGAIPRGSLILSGTTLYGMTDCGGTENAGVVFKIETDGTGFNLLHSFTRNPEDGDAPEGTLILLGSTLYGMTYYGGADDLGTIFKIETNGTGYILLHEFSGGSDDGKHPSGDLTFFGSSLYGMTRGGGESDHGTIFEIQTDGSDFSLLHSFAGEGDGDNPQGSLILSGSILYGMADSDGTAFGTIFKIETDGSDFTLLHSFNGGANDGKYPRADLTISGSILYGMTFYGGDNDFGIIFKIQTDGSGFSLMHEFNGGVDDGKWPSGSLSISGPTLYGMTNYGGDSDMGVIFSLPLAVDTHSISGTITSDGSGLAGVLMSGLPGNPVTNSSGFYSADVDHGWSGTVTPILQYYNFSPSSTKYSDIDGNKISDYTATLSKSLVVNNPNSASLWEKEKTYSITWLKHGAQNANVKIMLYKAPAKLIKTIKATTPNDGSFYWRVPTTLATGNNYFIRIKTVDDLISDDSDKFSIIVPTITVTAPTTGTIWLMNTTKTITWTKLGSQGANVKIQLFKGPAKTLDITLSTHNSGSYDWAIPSTLAKAKYTIRVTTLHSKVQGISKRFTIAE